jgi:nucleotide-binding universal stress UspA family protein
MYPFRKILLPVDYSEPCQAVLPYVHEMVRRFDAGLTLVHAYGLEAISYSRLPVADPTLIEDVNVSEDKRLREYGAEAFPNQHVEVVAELGEPGSVVHKVVQHQGTDLVMLATHGRGPIRRLLLGSVAAKVLHDVSAAVWTGTGSALAGHEPRIPYRSILCAVDDSDETQSLLKAAAAFAHTYEAELSLVQVMETPAPALENNFQPYRRDIVKAAEARLRDVKDQLGIDAVHEVIDGPVADGVRQQAIRRKADLIITGRGHAQDEFSRLWSHLYSIIRESPCPVLSI